MVFKTFTKYKRAELFAKKHNAKIHTGTSNYYTNVYYVATPDVTAFRLLSSSTAKRHTKFWNSGNLVYKGQYVQGVSVHRAARIFKLKPDELTDEAKEYLIGNRTPTEFLRNKTNPRMEAARISHALCDVSGQKGHDIRQQIRRNILRR